MRGFVVDKNGNPVQFRIKDPESGQISSAVAISTGTGLRLVDATQVVIPGQEQPQQQPTPPQERWGVQPGEEGGPAMPPDESGIVVADQVQSRPVPVPTPEQLAAARAAQGLPPITQQQQAPPQRANDDVERPAALAHGAAQEL